MSLSIERNIFTKAKTALQAISWIDENNVTQTLKNVDKYRGQFDPDKAAELQPSDFPAVFIAFRMASSSLAYSAASLAKVSFVPVNNAMVLPTISP